jgi:hypothetical protein
MSSVTKAVADSSAMLVIHALAVQRPNESNPLGFCSDIVKPVLSDWTTTVEDIRVARTAAAK